MALGVDAGGGVQGEGSSNLENVQGSGWLRIHLPAVMV